MAVLQWLQWHAEFASRVNPLELRANRAHNTTVVSISHTAHRRTIQSTCCTVLSSQHNAPVGTAAVLRGAFSFADFRQCSAYSTTIGSILQCSKAHCTDCCCYVCKGSSSLAKECCAWLYSLNLLSACTSCRQYKRQYSTDSRTRTVTVEESG